MPKPLNWILLPLSPGTVSGKLARLPAINATGFRTPLSSRVLSKPESERTLDRVRPARGSSPLRSVRGKLPILLTKHDSFRVAGKLSGALALSMSNHLTPRLRHLLHFISPHNPICPPSPERIDCYNSAMSRPIAITSLLVEAHLKCPTKCWLFSQGESGSGNAYADWVQTQHKTYRAAGIKYMTESIAGDGRIVSKPAPMEFKTAERWLAVDFVAQAQNSTSTLQMLERAPSEGRGKTAALVPIRFLFMNKLTRDDKLVLAFDALVLSQMVGDQIEYGKIVHGDNHTVLKVKTGALAKDLRTLMRKTAALIANDSPPDLVLNRHCVECEFRAQCRQKAIEKDDLRLLAGMTSKERKTYNSKGIFTINSLSYTFRARRRPKRMAGKREKYHHSLKALAIRDHKIHIVGRPEFKLEGTPVYLDVEALPDRDFYYLIGVRVKTPDNVVQYSLWADSADDERRIWTKFLGILSEVEKPLLIHYGSFETTFLRRMCQRYGELPEESILASAIRSAVNLLSVVFAQVYFPA